MDINFLETTGLFHVDMLSKVMMCLIAFVAFNILIFAKNHLSGDRLQKRFFIQITAVSSCLIGVTILDHIFAFILFWLVGNLILANLIIHKHSWAAAHASGRLAQKNFLLGALFLVTAAGLLSTAADTASIQVILQTPLPTQTSWVAATLIMLAALTQSGTLPFHNWLKSSLNSPTVVSAFMHAGLVNGGGFLLVRFAPLVAQEKTVMIGLFIIGSLTAFAGTFWKLVQSDVKRMLASSTIAQMGFMMVECGLGLFPAAVAHLVWHGLFKSHLFLSSSTIAQQPKQVIAPPTFAQLLFGLFFGGIGATLYWLIVAEGPLAPNSYLFMCVGVFVFLTQVALTTLSRLTVANIVKSSLVVFLVSFSYGYSVHFIEQFVPFQVIQNLNMVHYLFLAFFVLSWFAMIFRHHLLERKEIRPLWHKLYVFFLNSSQPHKKTVTLEHQHYNYQ